MFWVLESKSPFQFFKWPLAFWTEFCFVEEKTWKICGKTCGQFRLEESVLTSAEFFLFSSPHSSFPACFPASPWQTWPGDRQPHFHRASKKNEHSCHMTCTLGFYFVLDPPWFSFLFFPPLLTFPLCGLVCCYPEALSSKSQRDSVQKLVKHGGF